MRTNVRMGANAKRSGQMSTAAYAPSGSPEKVANVILIIFKVRV